MARVHPNRATAAARTHSAGLRHAAIQATQQGAAPQLPSAAGQGIQVQGAVDPYDFSADPILQRVQALGERRSAEAEAQALAARRELAISSGDESLAPDEETRLAAHNNPFSTAALFARKAAEEPKALVAGLSKQNLGYGSEGAKQQSNLATALLGEQASNQAATRGHLSDINAALLSAQQGVQNDITDAQGAAADRLQTRIGDTPVGYQGPGSATPIHGVGGIASGLGAILRGRPRVRAGHAAPHLPHHQP